MVCEITTLHEIFWQQKNWHDKKESLELYWGNISQMLVTKLTCSKLFGSLIRFLYILNGILKAGEGKVKP